MPNDTMVAGRRRTSGGRCVRHHAENPGGRWRPPGLWLARPWGTSSVRRRHPWGGRCPRRSTRLLKVVGCRYWSSFITPCWLWFACASIAVEAWLRICALARLVVSDEKSASVIWLFAAVSAESTVASAVLVAVVRSIDVALVIVVSSAGATGAGAAVAAVTVPADASNSLLPLNCVLASVEVICVDRAETSACMLALSDVL
ncbi:hypothetical protein WR25_24684 [Diploscapter pachys]|uniref:Uncharacterized protein n=1 Tax=Diploscapter pachys TaxID=2018661 RepID=A0A2A2KC36_9BILA|nr:hypothetical protein WR25_24684 [Diploscapter pachys]